VLGLIFWAAAGLMPQAGLWTAMFEYLAFINFAVAVFNLLPGYPLDGGRLLRAFLWHRSGSLKDATIRAGRWGAGIALGIIVMGVLQIFAGALVGGLWLVFIGMFLRGAAHLGIEGVVVEETLRGLAVRDVMIPDPVKVPPDVPVTEAIESYFLRYGYGGFPVGDDGDVNGLLSLAQVRACPVDERGRRAVRDVMRPLDTSLTIAPGASVADALRRMAERGVGRLLVMEGKALTGMITREAVMRFLLLKADVETDLPAA
jgi:CBS domain-containing protein